MLKRVLYYSCTSLLKGPNPFHEYYDKQRSKGKSHGQALKAVARKRVKVIYAVMRDKVPYTEKRWTENKQCSHDFA